MKKRIFSRALALLMALSLLSSTAFAATLQDLQDAIDGNTKTGTLIEGSEHKNHYGYGDLDEASGNWGIEAWDQDGGRNVQLNEDVVYNDGKDAAAEGAEDNANVAGDTEAGDTTDAANDGNAASDTAPDDITTVVIDKGKDVVIDLKGNSIEGDGEHDVIEVEEGGELTVKGTEPAERTEPEEPAPSADSGEAEKPADTANTIIGDIFNDGELTVDKATVDGNVFNSGTFNLNDSTVTKTIYEIVYGKNPYDCSVIKMSGSSKVGNRGEFYTYGEGGKYTLEGTADGKQKLTIYPDETGTIAGESYSWGQFNFVWLSVPDASQITEIEIKDGVTSIGDYAFSDCSSLTSVKIPDSVTSIGEDAFSGCSGLKIVDIPDSVTSIGEDAFYKCSSLTSVTIPDSVTSIGSSAFCGCSGLTSVTIPGSVTSIGDGVFYNCSNLKIVTIPDGVTSIGDSAFGYCSSLTSVKIPDGVISIGKDAFFGCSGLKIVDIPDGVTSIGDHAFYKCSSLTSVEISDGVMSIGDYAFSGCSSLTSVTIPDGVTSIGNSAFSGCWQLKSVEIPNGVTSIGDYTFSGCYYLTSVTIPDGVTSIGSGAFKECYSLPSVEIPDGVTSIGDSAFSECSWLKIVTIPDSVTSIGSSAFSKCYSLQSVTIPDSVTSIGKQAFSNCRPTYVINTKSDGGKTVTYYPDKATWGQESASFVGTSVVKTDDGKGNVTITKADKSTYDVTNGSIENDTATGVIGSGGTSTDGEKNVTIYLSGANIDRDGTINPGNAKPSVTSSAAGNMVTADSGTEYTDHKQAKIVGVKNEDPAQDENPSIAKAEDGSITITVPAGGMVNDEPWLYGGKVTIGTDGKIDLLPEAKPDDPGPVDPDPDDPNPDDPNPDDPNPDDPNPDDPNPDDPNPDDPNPDDPNPDDPNPDDPNPDDPGVIIPDPDVPMADGSDTDTAATIEDQEVPLAGLMSAAQLLEELRQYEEIKDVDLPEDFQWIDHEYAQAIYWALQKELVVDTEEEPFDPDEVVTVALLREVLTSFVELYKGLEDFVFTLEGEDDEIVMDLGERLTVFYGELEDYLKAQEAKAA